MNQLKLQHTAVVFLLLFFAVTANSQNNNTPTIWFDKPAKVWESEALPIGSGRMGPLQLLHFHGFQLKNHFIIPMLKLR